MTYEEIGEYTETESTSDLRECHECGKRYDRSDMVECFAFGCDKWTCADCTTETGRALDACSDACGAEIAAALYETVKRLRTEVRSYHERKAA